MNVYPFIEAEKQGGQHVKRACELLRVSRAAYYADRDDQPGARHREDAELTELITKVHQDPRTATALRASTPNCATAAVDTGASGSPG